MQFRELIAGDFERVEIFRDARKGVIGFVAIHSTVLGPAFGGIRRWRYQAPEDALGDALRLAEAMSLKCAISGVPGGGGKTVLMDSPELDRAAAYRHIGRVVEQLGGRYYTGPDVGTAEGDLDSVAEATSYVARPGPDGPGNLAVPTALGVFAGIEAVVERLGHRGLDGVRIAVQGLGEVGWRLCKFLADAGATLVVTDVRADVVDRAVGELGVTSVVPDAIVAADVDVYAPCALGGVIDDAGLTKLRARAVAGSANNVLASPRHGEELFRRGVLYAPDFVINSGALIHGALFHLEGEAPARERVTAIGRRLGEILDEARERGQPPEVVAETRARDRLRPAAE